jgi:hypothetical protein
MIIVNKGSDSSGYGLNMEGHTCGGGRNTCRKGIHIRSSSHHGVNRLTAGSAYCGKKHMVYFNCRIGACRFFGCG